MTVEQIVQETSQWPEEAVSELVDRIALAKHGGLEPKRETAWAKEALRRSAELESGNEALIPGQEVSDRIRKIVGQ